jgi:transcriptional regulator of acetoin/glycerol metabolism
MRGNDSPPALTIYVGMSLKEVERLVIQATLKGTLYNIVHTAKILGIDRSTLYSKIEKYNIRAE